MARISAKDRKALDKGMALFQRAEDFHSRLATEWKKSDEAFAGVLKVAPIKGANQYEWMSRLHPPYVAQIVEIMLANLVDNDLEADLFPNDPMWEDGAKAHECLMKEQMEKDRFRQKVVQYWLQLLVRGITCAKLGWDQVWEEAWYEVERDEGESEFISEWLLKKDQPTFIPWDMNDAFPDPGASGPEDIRFVYLRSWDTITALRKMAEEGPNGEDPIYNPKAVEELVGTSGSTRTSNSVDGPDKDLRNRVEVLEYWDGENLIAYGDRQVVLRNEPTPFVHGEIPAIFAGASPKLFRVEGRSVSEFIGDLQTMLWEFQNQKIDNARLMNNAVVLLRDSLEDSSRFQVYPGARWPVLNPQDVKFWEPNPSIIQNSVEIEGGIKEDILNLSGAVAYLSGASSEQIDNKTATGISIVSSGAQKRILFLKQQGLFGIEKAFNLWIKNNQQLISNDVALKIQKKYGGYDWIRVSPKQLVGDYEYRIRSTTESLNRQEKRQEALSLMQAVMSNAPISTQLDPTLEFDLLELWTMLFERFGLEAGKFVKRKQMNIMDQMMMQLNPGGDQGQMTPGSPPQQPELALSNGSGY